VVAFLRALLPSPRTLLLLGAVIVGVILLVSAGRDRTRHPSQTPSVPAGQVNFTGTGDIHFGTTTALLQRDHGLIRKPDSCSPSITDTPLISPVFVDNKLALMWIKAPLHTPEGITVGSPVNQVRAVYPQATAMPAPPAGQLPAIMVSQNDRAYLFLYSGEKVAKVLVGLQQYVQQLYQSGGDTC
jgi:hypothetical protein